MDDHVALAPARALIDHDANVGYASAEIPRHQVSRGVVEGARSDRQSLSFALEEHHKIGNAAVVDVGVGMVEAPTLLVRILREVLQHVFVNFFLQIDSQRAVRTNDFVGADTGICRHVAAGIWNVNVCGNVADRVMGPLDGRGAELFQKLLTGRCSPGLQGALREHREQKGDRRQLAGVDKGRHCGGL